MGKFKFLKEKVIFNKRIKIYSKKNSKKLYCKLKNRNKTEMVTIKDYKKMKGGVKKNNINPSVHSISRVGLATTKNPIQKSKHHSKDYHRKNVFGRINPFFKHAVDINKFALNKDNFGVSKKTAGFPLHRRRHIRIPHGRIPHRKQVEQKRKREIARQQFLNNELERERRNRINLNLGFKNKPVRRPYNLERERRNRIKYMGY